MYTQTFMSTGKIVYTHMNKEKKKKKKIDPVCDHRNPRRRKKKKINNVLQGVKRDAD